MPIISIRFLAFAAFTVANIALGGPAKKISVVIPVYREWTNGNILRQITQFAAQTADSQIFDLVLVVNNTPEIAADKENSIYIENQNTLRFLKSASRDTSTASQWPSDIQKVIAAARGKGLVLNILDLSTNGHPRNIGALRQRGIDVAVKHNKDISANEHIIAFLDADTSVESDYIQNLAAHYHNKRIESVFLNFDFRIEPGSVRELYASTFAWQYEFSKRAFHSVLVGDSSLSGGPFITATAEAIKRVGGVPKLVSMEDYELTKLLMTQTRFIFSDTIEVHPTERARPDSYDGATRYHSMGNIDPNHKRYGSDNAIGSFGYREFRNITRPPTGYNAQLLESFFAKLGIEFNEVIWREVLLAHDPAKTYISGRLNTANDPYFEYIKRITPTESLFTPADAYLNWFKKRLPEHELKTLFEMVATAKITHESNLTKRRLLLRELIERNSGASLEHDDFFKGNNWIELYVAGQLNEGKRPEEIQANMIQSFPDWFLPFDETPHLRQVKIFRSLRKFLISVQHNHQDFPQTSDYFRTYYWASRGGCENGFKVPL